MISRISRYLIRLDDALEIASDVMGIDQSRILQNNPKRLMISRTKSFLNDARWSKKQSSEIDILKLAYY